MIRQKVDCGEDFPKIDLLSILIRVEIAFAQAASCGQFHCNTSLHLHVAGAMIHVFEPAHICNVEKMAAATCI